MVYSTYLGGSSDDNGWGIAVDAGGAAYITGSTSSTDFPTRQAFQGAKAGNPDAFVTKLSPAGTALVYSTYLGGSSSDAGRGIAVDAAGAAYITGGTDSTDFPTQQAFQGAKAANSDAFVTKLSPTGTTLAYSTYLGGSSFDEGWGIAVDAAGAAYITGYTFSTDFPTRQAFQGALAGGWDAFVTKLSPAGNTLAYSTYLGGSSGDDCFGIAVDAAGAAYIIGVTGSINFPTANAFQESNYGGIDVFVAKFMDQPPPYLARPLIDYGQALSNPVLTFESGGQALWFKQGLLTPPARDIAESGGIGDRQYSWLQTTVNGPGTLNFDWQVSSQADHDYLQLWLNGILQEQISGASGWLHYSLQLGFGSHLIQWRYVKDASLSSGSDCGYLEKVVFTPGRFPFSKALDNRILTFRSGGDSLWRGQNATSYYGGSAAQSGPIGNNQASWLETTVVGPGELSFYWQTSCQPFSDYLEFSINGVAQDRISGPKDWRLKTFSLAEGWNTLRWTYKKDFLGIAGQDCGFLDQVVFTHDSRTNLNRALVNSYLGFETGGNQPWHGQVVLQFPPIYCAGSGQLTDNQYSWLKTVVTGPGKVKFNWKVSSQAGFDVLEFYLDGVLKDTISGEVGWIKKEMRIPVGDHALVWLYIKNSSISAGNDRGYVGQVGFTPENSKPAPINLLLQ